MASKKTVIVTGASKVDGDIGQAATAEKVARMAIDKFGSIDHVVNNAGIFAAKPFTDYTADEFRGFVSTNLGGFIFITQLCSPDHRRCQPAPRRAGRTGRHLRSRRVASVRNRS
jgi:NAD(P)-dependent dehydrogenase (short-subunit alcohol dehydrogenase family)